MKKEKIIEKVENKFGTEKFEFNLIEERDYSTKKDKIPFVCKKHGIFLTTVDSILRKENNCGCPECNKEQTILNALNEFRKIVKENPEIELKEFTKKFKRLSSILSSKGISLCELIYNQSFISLNDFQDFIINKDIQNSTDFEERFPGIYDKASSLKLLTQLNYPKVLWSKRNISKMTLEEVQKFMEENKIFTISDFEKIDQSMLTIIRRNKNIYNNLSFKRVKSYMETIIEDLLKENNIQFIYQKTFDWLINKSNLYLDFYIPEINLAIECQGCQHWIYSSSFGYKTTQEDFNNLVERDKLKYRLCKENNINIIYFVSPLTAHFKEIPNTLFLNYLNTVYFDCNELLNFIHKTFQNK